MDGRLAPFDHSPEGRMVVRTETLPRVLRDIIAFQAAALHQQTEKYLVYEGRERVSLTVTAPGQGFIDSRQYMMMSMRIL